MSDTTNKSEEQKLALKEIMSKYAPATCKAFMDILNYEQNSVGAPNSTRIKAVQDIIKGAAKL